ncbi:MAG: hypothetical protein Q8R28_03900 [Dehalococcoidia bacterium]|nr:hypothetical protein [Dehalococcoidia bacterium]
MGEATLNGQIVDDGGLVCEVRFEYGQTLALGTFTPWFGGFFVTGNTFYQVITGLAGDTVYYFRAHARNSQGSATAGGILLFRTTSQAQAEVATQPATGITENTAVLNGMVVNHAGKLGSVRFQYGGSTSYGQVTAWQDGFQAGNSFLAAVSGLSPGAAYHFRAQFQHPGSPPVNGADMTFSTLSMVGLGVALGDDLLALLEV